MVTSMNSLIAAEHSADLRRAAERRRLVSSSPPPGSSERAGATIVAFRLARADEARLVRRLAALDTAPVPDGQVLLALIDGEVVAALSLLDGRVVADPFVRTEDAVALLRLRAEHLWGAR